MDDVAYAKRPMSVNKEYYEGYLKTIGWDLDFKDDSSFWLDCKALDSETHQMVSNGKVRVSLEIYPKDQAENNKVGEARQEPNSSPYLPPPVGRISFTLNPFKMLVSFVI